MFSNAFQCLERIESSCIGTALLNTERLFSNIKASSVRCHLAVLLFKNILNRTRSTTECRVTGLPL